MAIVRCTAFFSDDDAHGWSEQHDIDGGSTPNLGTLLNNFFNLIATFRVPILAGDAFFDAARVSYKTADGAIASLVRFPNLRMHGTTMVGSTVIQTDASEVACKVTMQNAANTLKSDIYLRGIWDDAVMAGQLNFGGTIGTAFKNSIDAYTAALIAGQYGWQTRSSGTTVRGQVVGYTQNPDNTVTFNLIPAAGPPPLTIGQRYQANFARINNSRSILNRGFVVQALAANQVTTVKQVSTGDFETPGTFIITNKAFVVYGLASYFKLARRATGRPFGVGRGRRSVAVLH
jgi:hypothetical protein